ncbi:MAG: amidohydrolase family protein [Gammaproteobacteria bacterium]|nr:amidohydrolase family protein [Gammaproteobacteria bacterium]
MNRRCRTWSLALLAAVPLAVGASDRLELADFVPPHDGCYDRSAWPQTAVVDTHVHFRPFGGPAHAFDDVVAFMERTGVRFANVYGIGQMLPLGSPCTYYLDCPGVPVRPTLKNDFSNVLNLLDSPPDNVHLTLSMTFFDLERPDKVLEGIALLDEEFPGLFRWAGEVNLVKQALFGNSHRAVPLEAIARWKPFMSLLRERGIPFAVHSDLGSDTEPMKYAAWIEEVLRLYPNNPIVWMHMGLSRELTRIDPQAHLSFMRSLMDRYPLLMVDISWRIIDDALFSKPELRGAYLGFIEQYSERVLPGSDFVASADKSFETYREELRVTSSILGHLSNEAFRNIALGENYFRLLSLDFSAPPICSSAPAQPAG